jgi:hypothetical protein
MQTPASQLMARQLCLQTVLAAGLMPPFGPKAASDAATLSSKA